MTSALRWGWVVSATPRPLYPRERPGTHRTGGWVSPRAGLDGCGKSRPPTGIRSPDRPARSESLYRLSYRGPRYCKFRAPIFHSDVSFARVHVSHSLLHTLILYLVVIVCDVGTGSNLCNIIAVCIVVQHVPNN